MGLGGEGEGAMAVEGRIAFIPVLIWGGVGRGVEDDVVGSGVEDRARMSRFICFWLVVGGRGIWIDVGLAGRVVVGIVFLGVALLQSTFPRGKLSL